MRYLADILTLIRLVLAFLILILTGFYGSPEAVFIIFVIAEITDIFDGTCSRKWPFPKNKTPRYRKYSAKFDMFSDGLLAGAETLYLALRINHLWGGIILVYFVISALVIDLIVYGKLLGHPDNYNKNSLISKNFLLAKKIILARRYLYVAMLGVSSGIILFATNWPSLVKYGLLVFGCTILVFAWFFLGQRRHNISRDAIKIEKDLTQKSQKSSKR